MFIYHLNNRPKLLFWEKWIIETAPRAEGDADLCYPKPTPQWAEANCWIPMVASFLYFAMLIHGPEWMKNNDRPKWLKKVVFVWNIFLSSASSWAAWRMATDLYQFYFTEKMADESFIVGIRNLICMDTWSVNGMYGGCKDFPLVCLYLMLFCFSKIPEMLDTLWLILGKKNVIFLHWFHHSSVMWFCWLAWAYAVPMGIVFALMNLAVHSLMYAWYALAAADRWLAKGLKPTRIFSQTVTVLQIIQMILGITLTIYVHDREDCGNPLLVTRYALGMYSVYLVLFVHFFYRAYCRRIKPVLKKPPYAQDRFFEECSGVKGVDRRPVGGVPKPKTKDQSLN